MPEDQLEQSINNSANTLRDVNAIKEFKSQLIDGSDSQLGLAEVLNMLIESYGTLINSLSDFMGLLFSPDDERKKARTVLLRAKMGLTEAKLRGAHARCSYIDDIYEDFLRDWFDSKKLENKQLEGLKALFLDKLSHDSGFVREVEDVSDALRTASEDIYPLFEAGDFKQASRKVEEFSQRVKPLLQKISDEWKKLRTP